MPSMLGARLFILSHIGLKFSLLRSIWKPFVSFLVMGVKSMSKSSLKSFTTQILCPPQGISSSFLGSIFTNICKHKIVPIQKE